MHPCHPMRGVTRCVPKHTLAREVEPVTQSNEEPIAEQNEGFRIAVLFVGLCLVAAALFTLYFLFWDGGGNT